MSKENTTAPEQEVPAEETAPVQEPAAEEAPAPAAEAPKADASAELKAANDKYLRLLAEYDNYRKRTTAEKASIRTDVNAAAITAFLPVYDNLARALAQSTEDEAYRKGVEMIMTQFNTTLEKLGAKKIESLGQTFDPTFHNAIMHVDDDTKGENEIVEVFQEGFCIGEKVVRFAMVKVAN